MKIYNLLHGIYPRSEELIVQSRALDRGRISEKEFDRAVKADEKRLSAIVKTNNVAIANDGMLTHQDLFRRLIESTSGLKQGSLTRFFNTNIFFRQPVIAEELKLKTPTLSLNFSQKNAFSSVTLPSPATFVALAGWEDKRHLDIAIVASYLGKVVQMLTEQGFSTFVFHEPYLVFDPEKTKTQSERHKLLRDLHQAFSIIRKKTSAKLILITYFGDVAPMLPKLLKLPVDTIGIDFYETDLESLAGISFGTKGAFLGVVDARNSLGEDPRQIVAFVKKFVSTCKPAEVFLGSNCSLEFVPVEIAEKKLAVLSEVAKLLKNN